MWEGVVPRVATSVGLIRRHPCWLSPRGGDERRVAATKAGLLRCEKEAAFERKLSTHTTIIVERLSPHVPISVFGGMALSSRSHGVQKVTVTALQVLGFRDTTSSVVSAILSIV